MLCINVHHAQQMLPRRLGQLDGEEEPHRHPAFKPVIRMRKTIFAQAWGRYGSPTASVAARRQPLSHRAERLSRCGLGISPIAMAFARAAE